MKNFQWKSTSHIFLLLNLDLSFQGKIIGILFVFQISRKWWESVRWSKHYYYLFIVQWMATLWMLYIVIMTYIFKVNKFENLENGESWWEPVRAGES